MPSLPSGTLDLTTSVPRHYVHKAAQQEVLLTGLEALGDDHFAVSAQWPRSHSFYDVSHGRHDPLLLAETVRQAVPLLSHLGYDAPLGHRQIWDHLTWTMDPAALLCEQAPAGIDMRIRCSDIIRRGTRLGALTMDIELTRDGRPLGSATTRFANQAPAVYARLRGPYADLGYATSRAPEPGAPVEPARVGRDRRRDVVLAATSRPDRFELRTDLGHPVLFDHPVDHAPGMLLLEAARQAAHTVAYPRFPLITGMDVLFNQYVEYDTPCWIDIEVLPSQLPTHVSSRVTAVQNGVAVFRATVTALQGPLTEAPPA